MAMWDYRMSVVYSQAPTGAWIETADGERVGLWYASVPCPGAQLVGGNRIQVLPPDVRASLAK